MTTTAKTTADVKFSGAKLDMLFGQRVLIQPVYEDVRLGGVQIDVPNEGLFNQGIVIALGKQAGDFFLSRGVPLKEGEIVMFQAGAARRFNLNLGGKETPYFVLDAVNVEARVVYENGVQPRLNARAEEAKPEPQTVKLEIVK